MSPLLFALVDGMRCGGLQKAIRAEDYSEMVKAIVRIGWWRSLWGVL